MVIALHSKKVCCLALLLAAFIFSSQSVRADVSASVDRTAVSAQTIIQLTVRSTEGSISNLDTRELTKNFELLNQQQSQQYSMINGRSESRFDLMMLILPKRTGMLTIPAFNVNGKRTQPIRIEVTQGEAAKAAEGNVFIEGSLDRDKAYVQQQIIYTEKIFYSVPVDLEQPTAPAVENALVVSLGEAEYREELIKGIRYSVREARYALFPQKSGVLRVPASSIKGRARAGLNSRFSQRAGRLFQLQTETKEIIVQPKPAQYGNQTWLPTTTLALTDSWSEQPPQFEVGKPITRTIQVTAQGLSASVLPEVQLETLDGAKSYSDKPQISEEINRQGLLSRNTLSVAIVPNQPGTLSMPAVRVAWWNTKTDRLEESVIPGQSFTVAPAPGQSTQGRKGTIEQSGATAPIATTSPSSSLWPRVSALLAIAWLFTLAAWWKIRRQIKQLSSTSGVATLQNTKAPTEQQLYRALRKACTNNHAQQARAGLLAWGRARFNLPKATLETLAQQDPKQELSAILFDLDAQLYSAGGDIQWQGDALIQAVNRLRVGPRNKKASGGELKSLYPL